MNQPFLVQPGLPNCCSFAPSAQPAARRSKSLIITRSNLSPAVIGQRWTPVTVATGGLVAKSGGLVAHNGWLVVDSG